MENKEICLKIQDSIYEIIDIKEKISIISCNDKNLRNKIIKKAYKKDNNIYIHIYNNVFNKNIMEITSHIISCLICFGEDNNKQDYYYLIANHLILNKCNEEYILNDVIKKWSRISIKKGNYILNIPRKQHNLINNSIKNYIKNYLCHDIKYNLENLKQEIVNIYNYINHIPKFT